MLRRSTRREIFSTFGRFISIFAIVAIGVGFFSGVRISNDYMLENADLYLNELNFYDYRVITPLGSSEEEIEKIAALEGVNFANGAYSEDALASVNGGSESVYRFHSITSDVNKLSVISGRLPENDSECVLDSKYFGKDAIGATVSISVNNKSDTAS
jgi:putative ABC transport system permease protein